MATAKLVKPTKWFSKGLKLSLPRGAGRSFSFSKSPRSARTKALTSPSSSVTSPTKNAATNKEEDLRHVFGRFDGDGDGKVTALELRSYFGSVGEYLSHEDAQAVIDELDSDGDGMLDVDDFMRLMNMELPRRGVNGGDGNGDEDVRAAFEMYEMEKGSGCITPRSLQRMLGRLGDDRSFEECVAMINAYDTDGNGVLDFHEFHQMMMA